ncbi:transcriptional regulator, partial [Mesorhizobium sp. M00.F.Ca.ET.149.01.1.1]
MEDVLRSLGFLCLGSRMKRIGEQLQADTQRVLDRLDAHIQAVEHALRVGLQ